MYDERITYFIFSKHTRKLEILHYNNSKEANAMVKYKLGMTRIKEW